MPPAPPAHHSEAGYASVAAVAAIAVFALVALALVEANRGTVAEAAAETGQARAAAAADAGLALALDGLLAADRANRWAIDGRPRTVEFDGTRLIIRIEDERGKVPLALLDEASASALTEAAGLGIGGRAQTTAQSLLDWIDPDDEPRPQGAEREYYRRLGIAPRNGPLQSVGELARIRGFDPPTVERMRPFVTVHFGRGAFDPRHAHPAALGVMLGGSAASPAAIARQRERDGQTTAIELADNADLAGHPLTIAVDATREDGARAVRRTVIELTGSRQRPYIVRAWE